MIWNPEFECMAPAPMREHQSQCLGRLVATLYADSPVYRQKFDERGIRPEDIRSIDDISRLPFTTKTDLRESYPFGLFSSPLDEIREIHVSSGTTGNPTVVGYTSEDLRLWSTVMARSLACAGARPGDMIQIAYGYGLFTGGLGFHYGALELGLTVIPMSSGQTRRQLKIMNDFRPRILACTPSYALLLAEVAQEEGIDPRDSSWEIGVFGAEPWSEALRTEIEGKLGLMAVDIYGLSEIIGPGVSQECPYRNGLHIFHDVFYPEIIDPVSDRPVAPGQDGELVITSLTRTGIPLLRYRTRDVVSIDLAPCPCGRTSPRVSKIKGRTDDMIVIRGINVFPSQIEHVLLAIEGTEPHYQLVVDRKEGGMDELEVLVEVTENLFSDEIKELGRLEQRIRAEIENVLSLGVTVRLVEPKGIERSEVKAKRVIDRRHT